MYTSRVGIVVCRIGAIFLAVEAFKSLGYILPSILMYDGFSSDSAIVLLMFVVPTISAILLWVFAKRIASVPNNAAPVPQLEAVRSIDIVAIGMLIIGVYVTVYGVVTAVVTEVTALAMPDLGEERQMARDQVAARTLGSRASYIAQILLGMLLIFGRFRIAEILGRARRIGTGAT